MVNAQEWLDENYPKEERVNIEKLNLSNQSLEGNLDLADFTNLWKINISYNLNLGELKGVKNRDLMVLITRSDKNFKIKNYLKAQEWLEQEFPNKENIEKISWNSFDEQAKGEIIVNDYPFTYFKKIEGELTIANFPNLKKMHIGEQKLTKLNIINCPQLTEVYCSNNKLNDLTFVNCPNLIRLDCWGNQLNNLDLRNLVKLISLDCSNNFLGNNLNLSNCPQLHTLICRKSNLTSLDLNNNLELNIFYCDNWDSNGGKDNNALIYLDLSNNKQLTKFECSDNQLTELDLSNQTELTNVNCSNNYLKTIKLPIANQEKLISLFLNDNNFQRIYDRRNNDVYFFQSYSHAAWQDLSFLEPFVNLKKLWLGNTKEEKMQQGIYNRFHGSLKSLSNMAELEALNIENTDIDSGLEYLPLEKLNDFRYSFDKRQWARVDQIFYALCDPVSSQLISEEFWKENIEKLRKFQVDVALNIHEKSQGLQVRLHEERKKNYELIETCNKLTKQLEESQKGLKEAGEKNDELTNELNIEKDHGQDINGWYKRQLDSQSEQKRNELFNENLELKRKNQQQLTEINYLNNSLQINKYLTEQILERQAQEIVKLKSKDLTNQILNKKTKLTQLKVKLSNEDQEWLEIYCEAQKESADNYFAHRQLVRAQQKLNGKLTSKELKLFIQLRDEIEKLKQQLTNLNINNEQNQDQQTLQIQPTYDNK